MLQALAPERVVLIGSASKTLRPRCGWAGSSPAARLADALAAERWHSTRRAGGRRARPGRSLERGELERHLRRTRAAYRARRRGLVEALGALGLHPVAPGVHAGCTCASSCPGGRRAAVAAGLQAQRINVRALAAYRLQHPGPPGLVIGYGRLAEGSVPAIVDALVRAGAAAPPGQ